MSSDQTEDKTRVDLNLKDRSCNNCNSCKCDKKQKENK